ncbi:hypothetical protein VOLCADRAFT_96559 [Volvox carteri f. nagariensis]|uniref:Right handed beta helix domain-containing protein n=1 Tax=Volvox carteri f. nagariensis TaxID=3068 RepID=D8UAF1_VOLCA|nr:uncharacterized protein VOLCADRAFT_96559 [Volvox carteri f. nagariensis]EFJ43308.1 hypothetical protein VOLCADRAFT_96559 [Volvox carteri f. nagariensis]|eukprot:XP_002955668.1 hypothetical protein VOLCADRAFT_96559 [Volvox carteri f. nagariensis]
MSRFVTCADKCSKAAACRWRLVASNHLLVEYISAPGMLRPVGGDREKTKKRSAAIVSKWMAHGTIGDMTGGDMRAQLGAIKRGFGEEQVQAVAWDFGRWLGGKMARRSMVRTTASGTRPWMRTSRRRLTRESILAELWLADPVIDWKHGSTSSGALLFVIMLTAVAQDYDSRLERADAELDRSTRTCRIVLVGHPTPAAGASFSVSEFNLHCWLATPVGGTDSATSNGSNNTDALVEVRLGQSLLNFVLSSGAMSNMLGVNIDLSASARPAVEQSQVSGAQAPTYGSYGYSSSSLGTGKVRALDGNGTLGPEDWGLDIVNVPHLQLVDSVVSGIPLSSVGPLLQILNCSTLTTRNVTLEALHRPPDVMDRVYGAVRVTRVQAANLDGIQCSDVQGAMGWACLLLQANPRGTVSLSNSLFVNNSAEDVQQIASAEEGTSDQKEPALRPLLTCRNNGYSDTDFLAAGYGAVLIVYNAQCDASVRNKAMVLVHRTVMSYNSGGCGAGIAVRNPPERRLTDEGKWCNAAPIDLYFAVTECTFTHNTADMDGGAIHCSNVVNGTLYSNISDGSVLSFNTAGGRGGGAYLRSINIEYVDVTSSEVSYNKATGGSIGNKDGGGGLYLTSTNSLRALTIYNSTVNENSAALFGGAVAVNILGDGTGDTAGDGGSLLLTGSSLRNNAAGLHGGAMYVFTGAKATSTPIRFAADEGSILSGNQASFRGGAIAIDGGAAGDMLLQLSGGSKLFHNAALDGSGGAVYINCARIRSLNATDATISGNNATCRNTYTCGGGGGIYMYTTKGPMPHISFSGQTLFANNTADRNGGALFVFHDSSNTDSGHGIFLNGSTFVGNIASTGSGGAVFVKQSSGGLATLQMSNTSFLSNVGLCQGGAVFLNISGTVPINQPAGELINGTLGSVVITDNSVLAYNSVPRRIQSTECPLVSSDGGAIYIAANRIDLPLTVAGRSSIIENSAASSGGAIYVQALTFLPQGGFIISDRSNVSSNTAGGSGGAVHLSTSYKGSDDGYNVSVLNSSVANNFASAGGFLYFSTPSLNLRLRTAGSRVVGNRALNYGGGIYVQSSDGMLNATVEDRSLIALNEAGIDGGALYFINGQAFDLYVTGESSILRNQALSNGGGMYVVIAKKISGTARGAGIFINESSTISSNTAISGGGGAIYVKGLLYNFSVDGLSRIENNIAGGDGGAVFLDALSGAANAGDESYIGNVTWDGMSTLLNNSAGGKGGGLYALAKTVEISVLGASSWSNNNAKDDGGVLYVDTGDYIGDASRILTSGRTQLCNNSALNGGAFYIRGFAELTISNESSIINNTAGYDGGAIYLAQLPPGLRIHSCKSSENMAARGSGGVLFVSTVAPKLLPQATRPNCVLPLRTMSVSVARSLFASNTAGAADGGAFFFKPHGTCGDDTQLFLNIDDSVFVGNTATGAGGAVALRDASLTKSRITINGTTFSNNSAGAMTGDFTSLASFGGAVLVWREPTAGTRSNFNDVCQLTIGHTTFEANSCNGGSGGAVMAISCGSTFSGCNFTSNRAMLSGGAIGALHMARSTATLMLPTTTTLAAATAGLDVGQQCQQGMSAQQRRHLLRQSPMSSMHHRDLMQAEMLQTSTDDYSGGKGDANTTDDVRLKLLHGSSTTCTNSLYRNANWSVSLTDCSFDHNIADLEYGGALYLYASSDAGRIHIASCNFTRNAAAQRLAGAALLAARGIGTTVHVSGSSFVGNTVEVASAGGLYTMIGAGACAEVVNVSMNKNEAAISGGAGIFDVRSKGVLLLLNVTAVNNTAIGGNAGAIQLQIERDADVLLNGCNFVNNRASGNGGAVLLDAICSSSVTLQETFMTRNEAGLSGGALYVSYSSKGDGSATSGGASGFPRLPAQACSNMSDPQRQALLHLVRLESNTARRQGGAIFLARAGTLNILNSTMLLNRACEGGGSLAAQNCSSLVLRHSLIAGNSASGTGGGFYANGCRRLLLEYLNFTGNVAGVSGGGLTISGSPIQVPVQKQDISAKVEEGDASEYTSMLLHRVRVSSNSVSESVTNMDVCGNDVEGVEHLGGKGMGGGLSITGKTVGVLSRSNLEESNYALFGTSIASTQRCYPANGTSSSTALTTLQVTDPIEMQDWDRTWMQLDMLAAMQCWILQLSDTLLPSVAFTGSAAAAAMDEEQSGATPSGSWALGQAGQLHSVRAIHYPPHVINCSILNSVQNATRSERATRRLPALWPDEMMIRTIWVDDFLASALHARCSPGNETIEHLVKALSQAEQSGMHDFDIGRTVMDRLVESRTKRINSAEFFAGQVLGLVTANGTVREAAEIAADMGGLSHKRFAQLTSQLSQCMSFPTLYTGPERQKLLMQLPYIALPATYIGLRFADADTSTSQRLQLQPGVVFNLTAQLYDMFGQRVVWDIAPSTISLALRPRTSPDATYNATVADGSAPLLDNDVANLDAGLNRSLTVSVVNGSATWEGVKAYAWPGFYSLMLSFSSNYSSYVKVTPLEMTLEVIPCRVGETLDLSRSNYKPSWTGCKTCPSGQYGLWHDDRPSLTAISVVGGDLSGATVTAGGASGNQGIYYQRMNATLYAQDSACRICPINAVCLGGAVIVPTPGYWHSAANSTKIHTCPNPSACNFDGDVKMFPDWLYSMVLQSEYRTKLLARCQLEWYASTLGPVPQGRNGTTTLDLTSHARELMQLLQNSSIDLLPAVLLNSDNPAFQMRAPDLPRCLVSGLPSGHPDSYMQQQCAEGYTGNLCAACVPGYSIDSAFNCKRCPQVARTVGLGLMSFFSSVGLILFTTVANFAEGFGEKKGEHLAQMLAAGGKAGERVEMGDVVKVIVLHLQYLIIENYLVYSPSCLLPGRDSAGQAFIQWLAGILTPCAVATVSMLLWALRYAYPLRKIVSRAVMDAARSAWMAMVYVHKRCPNRSLRYVTQPAAVCTDNTAPTASCGRVPEHSHVNISMPGSNNGSTSLIAHAGSIGLRDAFKHVGVIAFDAEDAAVPPAAGPPLPSCPAGPAACTQPQPAELPVTASVAFTIDSNTLDTASATKLPQLPSLPTVPSGDCRRVAGLPHLHFRDPNAAAAASRELGRLVNRDIPGMHHDEDPGAAGGSTAVRPTSLLPGANSVNLLAGAPSSVSPCAPPNMPYYLAHPSEATHRRVPKALSYKGSLADAIKTLQKLRALAASTQLTSQATFVQVDKAMSLVEQLGVVLMAAVFILYPSWAHAALSTFACYPIDGGEGPFPETQQAQWRHGYWLRNMQAMCYSGDHLHVYVPIGVVAVVVFCVLPPLVSFIFVWRVRGRLEDAHVRKVYGFLYKRYKPRFIWWETVLQLETLILVSVEVLGRGLSVSYQALLLLAVFTVIALINVSCAPLLSRLLVIMEFMSLGTLSLTITLSLYFTVGDGLNPIAEALTGTAQVMQQKLAVISLTHGNVNPRGSDSGEARSSSCGGDTKRVAQPALLNRLASHWRGESAAAPAGVAASSKEATMGRYRNHSDGLGDIGSRGCRAGSDSPPVGTSVRGLDMARATICLQDSLNSSALDPTYDAPNTAKPGQVWIALDDGKR